jgi:hypothetical protein
VNVITHATLLGALIHARALARCSFYATSTGGALPRCDSPKWGDPSIRGVARRACACVDRSAPDSACIYRTRAHTRIHRIGALGLFVVRVTPLHALLRGEIVNVGGTNFTITDAGARLLTALELADLRDEWGGD